MTFLTVEAWTFLQLGARQQDGGDQPFPHRWGVMFLAAVGFWNFLGAGVFGFLINLPVVSYYEIGRSYGKPRSRRHDGRLRHAGHRPSGVLSALPAPAGRLERTSVSFLSGRSTSGWRGWSLPTSSPSASCNWLTRDQRLLACAVDRVL